MSLKFFENYLENQYNQGKIETMFPDSKGNVKMCCPFKHTKQVFDEQTWETKEVEYLEVIPSSSINLNMRVFRCFTCSRTFKEVEFAEAITGKTREEILRENIVIENLQSEADNWRDCQHKVLLENSDVLNKLYALKFNDETIESLNLGYMTECLAFPVFKNDKLVNVARYNINKKPDIAKVRYNKDALSGDIIPFDVWKNDNHPTIVCEGEKDMAVARSHGFNAITLTGGSQSSLQKEYFDYFKDRTVYICYDNDDAGRRGALKLYKDLKKHCKSVHITDISSVCVETKEDITDFFVKYNKSAEDLKAITRDHSTQPTEEDLKDVNSKYELPITKIENNIENCKFDKNLKSTLQIVAMCTETYAIPQYATFTPREDAEDTTKKAWYASSSKADFLELMEGKVKTMQIPGILATKVGLGNKWEASYDCELGTLQTIYKYTVSDQAKEDDEKASEFTIDLYSKVSLDIGNIYEITYKLYPHPTQGSKTIAIASNIEATSYEFDVTNSEYTNHLNKFKVSSTIENKIEDLYESAKCHIAPYLNKDLWFLMDLVFNSPLDITYRNVMRGALDVFVLGDTRTGKALPLYEKVLTEQGYKPMGDITLNDRVFTENGELTSIEYIAPQGVRPVYKITFSDGASVDADEEHLWKVQSSKQRNCTSKYKILTTKQLLENGYDRYSIDRVKPIQFSKKELLIDPYTLGVLIGDGAMSYKSCIKLTNSENDIIQRVEQALPDSLKLVKYSKRHEYGISSNESHFNYYVYALRKLGLQGRKSRDKFIPEAYKHSCVEDRVSILRGLIDTDGYVNKNYIEYSTTSEYLANDIKFIVESLGGRITINEKTNVYGNYYRLNISFYNDIVPFLSEKHSHKYVKSKRNYKRYIKDIHFIGYTETQCIRVKDSSHTFVTSNMIVTHNSETSRCLKKLYDFGEVVPLKTATSASLIGGTDDKLKKTKLGVLPRYHKQLVVMEEFSGAPIDFIRSLTEIRSSSMVKIYRVAGDIQAPCKLRMITISNPLSDLNIASYPNGIEPLRELITAPEDVARYDAFMAVPRVENLVDPSKLELKKNLMIDSNSYKHKSKWIKSLTSDNVIISDELASYIFEKGKELNSIFESSFTVFGSETDKKIARLSSALACMLCSTEDFIHINVKKEHIDYIVEFVKRLYDNKIFKLREFATEEKSYSETVDIDTKELESLYPNNAALIDFLSGTSRTNRNELQIVSGAGRDAFTGLFNKLISRKFIKLNKDIVNPTLKFRKTYNIMDKSFNLSDKENITDTLNVFE